MNERLRDMVFLAPARFRDEYWKDIEKALNDFFLDLIYRPMVQHVEIQNRRDNALVVAIRKGRVRLINREFSGEFNAEISKILKDLGAIYNIRRKTWSLKDIPVDVQMAQAQAEVKFNLTKSSILSVLDGIDSRIGDRLRAAKLDGKYSWAIRHMNQDFLKSVKAVTVAPTLTPEQEAGIAQAYSKNLELYVQDFTRENTLKLRELVRASVFAGDRATSLSDIIQKNFNTTRAKANFLARQETSLLLSKFHEQRFRDVGVSRYKWSTSNDRDVRHDHKLLNGKIFFWDQPPIVNRNTGKKANPGEDYGCRCTAIPIWE